jgi:TP901 family phage tail tape measure protein
MAINVPIISQFMPKGIEDAQKAFGKLGDDAVKVGDKLNKLALVGVGAVVAGAGGAIHAFANFDQKMTESTAIMGNLTDVQMNDLSKAARNIGKSTKFGANDAAEALYFLASAGLDTEQVIGALPTVAAFAGAGNFDLARATDILTDAQSALGLSSQDTAESMANMSRVSDVLVRAATLANTSVEQLGEALTEKAGAAIKASGMEFEGAAAALAMFADSGVKGSAAGTKLTAVIDSLAQGSRVNSDVFEQFGINVYDAEGNMSDLYSIVGEMEIAFADMTVEQRNAALSQMGLNKQALAGINLLYGNSDAMIDYRNELVEAGGMTDKVANKQMQTFNARLELLKGRFMDVAIEIGSRLMPHLERLFDIFEQHVIPAVSEFARKVLPILQEKFNEAREAIEPVVRVLAEKFFTIVEKVVNWMKENTNTVKVFFAVMAGAMVILMLVSLAAKIAALFNPVTLIIVAIALLAAGFYHLWQNSETFRDIVIGVFNVVKEVVMVAVQAVINMFNSLKDIITGFINIIRGIFTGDLKMVMDGFKDLFKGGIMTVVNLFLGMPRAILQRFGPALANFGKTIVSKIVDGIKSAAGAIGSALLSAIPGGGLIGSALGGAKKLLGFKDGGLVPGSSNTPVPIMAHGGEYVLSADVVQRIRQGSSTRGAGDSGGGITINVAGSVISEGDLIEQVRIGLVEAQRSGRRLVA